MIYHRKSRAFIIRPTTDEMCPGLDSHPRILQGDEKYSQAYASELTGVAQTVLR